MVEHRLGRAMTGLIAAGLLAAGCASATTESRAAQSSSIVALGDSVPRGTNCNCTPYPPLTAEGLAGTTGKEVTATNDSVAGYTTNNVLKQLTNEGVKAHIRKAEVV